jgi:hypothetical protein|tara:strand:+ start:528 stop:1199 length:672 start_codon:yes stop_codon:yes gene_type:complete
MKISKRSLKKIIRETTASDPVQMLINFLSNNDIFMGTEQVVYWLQQQGIEETQIDSILNDSRLDNYYEESDDSWGISEVPYKFPSPLDETKMRITKRQLRRIISEYQAGMLPKNHVDGQPWSGSLEDLATVQGNTWGGGSVVDPDGWSKDIGLAVHWTKGTARSAKARKLNERWSRSGESKLRQSVLEFVDSYMLGMQMDPSDPTDMRRVRRTIDDIIGSVLG